MADLKPLIRVRRHAVEQKQEILADLYRQSEELEFRKKELESQLDTEREKVKTMDMFMLSYFGPYAEAVKGRLKNMAEGIRKLGTRIQIAREDMREAFADLKKIQITQTRRDEAEKKELDKKESAELDEIGIDAHRRQED